MEKTIKIGGELESVATGGIVAAASAIKDKAKGKFQGEINAEVDASLEDRYTKEETYSKQELNSLITTPSTNYETVEATEETTDVTDVLPATGEADTIYRVGSWDGSQYDATCYSEYAWKGDAYIHLSTKSQIGEVFDISAYHATGGELATYIDLAAALDSNNGGGVPQSLQKGGMSVKFVQENAPSSDNMYVQYRLMPDSWSIDTDDWSFCGDDVLADDPEFIYVYTDKEDRILWGLKKDGTVYYGVDVPQQVKEYIAEQINLIKTGTSSTSLDGINKIAAFLADFSTSDTLKALLDEKVDKEEHKSLIQSDVADNISFIEDPEYLDVHTDEEGRVIDGTKKDGTRYFNSIESPTLDALHAEILGEVDGKIEDVVVPDNKYSSISWYEGQYAFATGTAAQTASKSGRDSLYARSHPFLMKKGDIVEWNGDGQSLYKSSLNPLSAAICATSEDDVQLNPLVAFAEISADGDYYKFIAPYDLWVTCNVLTAKNDADHFKWYHSMDANNAIDCIRGRAVPLISSHVLDIVQQCKHPDQTPGPTNRTPQLCLLHFSDYHNDYNRVARILRFNDKYKSYIDDVVCTGDGCMGKFSDYVTQISEIEGFDKVLYSIGNHDIYDDYDGSSTYTTISYKDRYERWMMGKMSSGSTNNFIAGWGVVQPSGAGENDFYPCYYYKDYTAMNVRLICVDCEEYEGDGGIAKRAAQLAWFTDVLDDAKTQGLHVMVMEHFAPGENADGFTQLETGFNTYADNTNGGGNAIEGFADAIDDFITNGGIFICWLCGHVHHDRTAIPNSHPKQLYLLVPCASIGSYADKRKRTVGEESEDCFNIVAVDTLFKTIKVARIGAQYNRFLQHQGTMCISYDTTNGSPRVICSD